MRELHRNSALELAKSLAEDFATRANEADIAGALPVEDVEALRTSGYLTLSIPTEFGGPGLTLGDCVAAQLELAQGSPASALVAAMPLHIFGHAWEIQQWPTETFETFSRAALEEGALFNSIASEPSWGSPSRGGLPGTSIEKHDTGWLLNGYKTWATGGKHLTHMLVRVRVEDEPGVALVHQGMQGIEWTETWSNALSLRASDSHDVHFKNVIIPAKNLIERGTYQKDQPPNAWFPILIATIYLGAAIAARNAVIQFALERVPTSLGKPIATLPKIQRQIGELDLVLQTARLFLLKVTNEWTGRPEDRSRQLVDIVAAKHIAVEAANEVTDKALRIAGGQGITRNLPLERYYRDARAGLTHPPDSETALAIVGRQSLQIDKTS